MQIVILNEKIFGEYIDHHVIPLPTKNQDNPIHQSQDINK